MNEIFNNPWVTGIGGGIISSLIVFFVTRYAFSKKEKKEYNQKLETANNELLYSVRPLIIEKKIPSVEIFSAIRLATAKKYGVNPDDLFSEFTISNDLINEIMNNSFLSSDQKIELCELLNTMKERKDLTKKKEVEVIYLKDKDNLASKYNSIVLATVSFVTVIAMTFTLTMKENNLDGFLLNKDKISIFLIATLVPLMAILMVYILKILREKEKNYYSHKKTKDTDDKEDINENIA